MADIKISQMTDGGAALSTDSIPAVRAGSNVKVNVSGLTPKNLAVSVVTADYEIVLLDNGTIVEVDKATEALITIPDESDVDFPIGAQILFLQKGLGQVTFTSSGAVSIFTPETLSSAKQNAMTGIYKSAADEWVVFGNLEAV